MITGPYITETIVTVSVEVSSQEVLDLDAYWNLDFDGTPLEDGAIATLLYAKVAFTTLAAARQQFRLEQDAHAERNRPKPRLRRRNRQEASS